MPNLRKHALVSKTKISRQLSASYKITLLPIMPTIPSWVCVDVSATTKNRQSARSRGFPCLTIGTEWTRRRSLVYRNFGVNGPTLRMLTRAPLVRSLCIPFSSERVALPKEGDKVARDKSEDKEQQTFDSHVVINLISNRASADQKCTSL